MLRARRRGRGPELLRMSALATDAVYEALSGDLRRWFDRRAAPDRVDDLLQETFARVHERLPGLRDTQRVGPWVFRIARSVLVDEWRRAAPLEPLEEEPTQEAQEPLVEPDALVAAWLPFIVASLPEPYREALELSELQGLSQAELAKRLGMSPSGARTRVQRGRNLLRQQLEACCEIAREGGQVLDWTPRDPCACGASCGD